MQCESINYSFSVPILFPHNLELEAVEVHFLWGLTTYQQWSKSSLCPPINELLAGPLPYPSVGHPPAGTKNQGKTDPRSFHSPLPTPSFSPFSSLLLWHSLGQRKETQLGAAPHPLLQARLTNQALGNRPNKRGRGKREKMGSVLNPFFLSYYWGEERPPYISPCTGHQVAAWRDLGSSSHLCLFTSWISNNSLAHRILSSPKINEDGITSGTVLWLEAWALDSNDLVPNPTVSFFVFGVNVLSLSVLPSGAQWDLSHFSH